MSAPTLKPGKVYRTKHFEPYNKNPMRWAAKLVAQGALLRLRKGLFYVPKQSDFGEVPPSERELLRAYFQGPYLRTGPSVWNALGLGSTSVEAVPLIYNRTRSGPLQLGSRRFELKRTGFPSKPTPEFFVVDLIENAERSGLDKSVAQRLLALAVRNTRFSGEKLTKMASRYGSATTRKLVQASLRSAADGSTIPPRA